MSSNKVLLLKYVARLHERTPVYPHGDTQLLKCCCKTAIIVSRTREGCFSIQGYPPIPPSEKHKAWSLLQEAVKQLLGISKDVAICMQSADSASSHLPEMFASISCILRQPQHIIDVIVRPIEYKPQSNLTSTPSISAPPLLSSSSSAAAAAAASVSAQKKDPYCVFREYYHHHNKDKKKRNWSVAVADDMMSRSQAGPVREKCDYAEMNKLLSQLSEVSICLHRTQHECELIAKRCGRNSSKKNKDHQDGGNTSPLEPGFNTNTNATDTTDNKSATTTTGGRKKLRTVHSMCSSTSDDSGKHSMLESAVEEDLEEDDCVDGGGGGEAVGDERVEQLLQIAQQLTRQIQQRAKGKPLSRASSLKVQRMLPDAPTQVTAQPSFRYGGAYVMWTPVSIDEQERNHAHRVCGYQVYLDDQLCCRVSGPLTSQAEVAKLKDNSEYTIRVCTECSGCTSALTPPLLYRHRETNLPLAHQSSLTPTPLPPPISSAPLPVSADQLPQLPTPPEASATTATTTAIATSAESPPPPPATTSSSSLQDSKVVEDKVHTWLKSRNYDSNLDNKTQSTPPHTILHNEQDHQTPPSLLPRGQTSLPNHAPLHVHFADEEDVACNDDAKSISSSHTSGIVTDFPTSPKLVPFCCCKHCSADFTGTHDDSKLSMLRNGSHANDDDGDANDGPVTTGGSHKKSRTTRKEASDDIDGFKRGPSPPTNVSVTRGGRGELRVSWDPVQRDRRGCSNGYFVTGYHIYVDGNYQQTVDGATTSATVLTSPVVTAHQLQRNKMAIDVRTRTIAAESVPSDSIMCHLQLLMKQQQQRHSQRQYSMATNSLLATYV